MNAKSRLLRIGTFIMNIYVSEKQCDTEGVITNWDIWKTISIFVAYVYLLCISRILVIMGSVITARMHSLRAGLVGGTRFEPIYGIEAFVPSL